MERFFIKEPTIFLCLFYISAVGLLGVYSATHSGGTSPLFFKQLLYVVIGWFIVLFLSRFNFRTILEYAPVIYGTNLFVLVLVPFVGKTVYGAKRWIDLGPVHVQPSEFMKFSLILLSAYAFSRISSLRSKEFFILLLAFATPSTLVLTQPDLGTTVAYFFILLSALFFFGLRLRYLFAFFLFVLFLSPVLWHFLKDYQKKRILAVLDPYQDYAGSGYQLVQSIIAVGSGSLFGKGFLKGTQAHLLFLPEKHTDFIFSVIAEEMGFFVGFLLISAFFVMAWRLFSYVLRADIKEEVLFLGVFFLFLVFEVFVNIAMTMGFMPVVGIPLPLVSYGGSSVLTFALLLGTALSIVKELRQKPIDFSNG